MEQAACFLSSMGRRGLIAAVLLPCYCPSLGVVVPALTRALVRNLPLRRDFWGGFDRCEYKERGGLLGSPAGGRCCFFFFLKKKKRPPLT